MPYEWTEPAVVMDYFGVKIYNTYRHDIITDAYEYNFTTDMLGSELGQYVFDVRGLPWYKTTGAGNGHIDESYALKRAIEHQALSLPTEHDVRYPFLRGSFNWYLQHPHMFIRWLSRAVQCADMLNQDLIRRAFPHMIGAYLTPSWNKVFTETASVTDSPKESVFLKKYEKSQYNGYANVRARSFFWYLKRSGNFVTRMATAIVHADLELLEKIKACFQQMVAAAKMIDWKIAPDGFKLGYNSEREDGKGSDS